MIISQSPVTQKQFATFEPLTPEEIFQKLEVSQSNFLTWKKTSFAERKLLFSKLASVLREKKSVLAVLMAEEMGKAVTSGAAEIEKCALSCEYYVENGEKFLADEVLVDAEFVGKTVYDPLGVILGVMPWNFPFWQVFRFAVPAIFAGNAVVLKHASNVPRCALAIEQLFLDAGFPMGVFQTLLISAAQTEQVIRNPYVKAVSLTGSTPAGASVASIAGSEIKKVVLELGGSDPFIVLADADVDQAAQLAVTGRFINNGQSCIAAKRFLVHESIFEEFVEKFTKNVQALKIGDPLDPAVDHGSLASEQVLLDVERQVAESVRMGARVVTGGNRLEREGYFYMPAVLVDVASTMPVMAEEVFGPVAPVMKIGSIEEAIGVANSSEYGLGASIFTQDTKKAEHYARQIDSGIVAINDVVKSDPRLPFGGVKKSGIGRELAAVGIREFVNVKTVVVTPK